MALSVGVDYTLFYRHLNMTKLKPFLQADKMRFQNRMKEQETIAYMHGINLKIAISCALDGKKNKFPDKPIQFFDFDKTEKKELTEEEVLQGRKDLFAMLEIMQINHEMNKK